MKLQAIAVVAILGTALSGCASIIKGQSEEIAVSTPPAPGATCTLKNTRGEWTVTTPAAVTVKRSKKAIDITCSKDGYQEAKQVVPSDFEYWTLANLLGSPLIGFGIDAATGATNRYPSSVTVQMQPTSTGAAEAPKGPSAPPAKSNAAPTS